MYESNAGLRLHHAKIHPGQFNRRKAELRDRQAHGETFTRAQQRYLDGLRADYGVIGWLANTPTRRISKDAQQPSCDGVRGSSEL